MGASAADRIALLIETRADLSGAQAVRTETTALGAAVKQATESAAQGEQKLAASIDQVRLAQSRSNGDFERFKTELASIVRGEDAVAKSANAAARELERQKAALALPGPTGPQLGPALPGLTTAQAAAASAATLDQISPRARQAGNSLGLLAAAAASGNGSLSGLATAAGNVAQGISVMSNNARLAAGAAGIGALAASIGILIGLAIEAKRKLEEIPDGVLTSSTQQRIQGLKTIAQVEQQLALARQQADAAAARVKGRGDEEGLRAAANAMAKVQALEVRAVEIRRDTREKELAEEKQHRERQLHLNKSADAELRQLANAALDAHEKATLTSYQASRQHIDREFKDRKEDIEKLQVDEARKTALLTAAARLRGEQLAAADAEIAKARAAAAVTAGEGSDDFTRRYDARLAAIEAEKDAQIKAGIDVAVATEIAEQKKRKLQRDTALQASANAKIVTDALLSSNNKALHALGAFGDTVRRVIIGAEAARAAVRAAVEGAEAIASSAVGDFRGAALHGAASLELAAAAALGARESLGGGGSGASSGGGGGAAGDSTTFQPRGSAEAGSNVIILQTIDPYSREKINEVQYLIGRAGVLKRPINLPPTLGLQGAA